MNVSAASLTIREAHQALCAPDWSWEHHHHNHDFLLLWMVRRGRGRLQAGSNAYTLRPGDCFLLRMWHSCRATHDPKHPLDVLWVLFQTLDAKGVPIVLGNLPETELPPVHRRLDDIPFMSALLERAAADQEGKRAAVARHWLAAALLEMEREDSRPPRHGPDREAYERLHVIAARIRQNPGADYRVADLAREAKYSPEHFSRLFQRYEKTTPRRFIIQARIDAARSLLRGSDHKIARIAELLGYSDVYHFSRQFKEEAGVTPSRYRQD